MAKPQNPLKKHAIRRVTALAWETPWAITQEKLALIHDLLERRAEGHLSIEEIQARIGPLRRTVAVIDEEELPYQLLDGIAVIPLSGILGPRMNMMMEISGGTSTEEFSGAVLAAAEAEDVRAIVCDVDSPGGSCFGIPEAAEIWRAAGESKPTLAVGTGEMCSAAYWIASAAREVLASPSTQVGGVGVVSMSRTTARAEANAGIDEIIYTAGPNKGLGFLDGKDPRSRPLYQQRVDDYYRLFVEAVARHREVTPQAVESDFGGFPVIAERALAAGMIDRIGTLSEVIAELATQFRPAPLIKIAGGGAPRFAAFPINKKENHIVDRKVIERLQALNLIGADADSKAAEVALAAWFAAHGQAVPKEPAAILAGLEPLKPGAEPGPATAPLARPIQTVPAPGPPQTLAAAAAERDRILNIQARGELLGVEPAAIQAAVEGGVTVEKFLLDNTRDQARRNPPVGRIDPGESGQDKWHAVAVEALARRCRVGGYSKPAEGPVRTLQYASAMEIARETLRLSHGRTLMGTPEQLAQAALGDLEMLRMVGASETGYATPGDFPNILAGLGARTLDAAPRFQSSTFQNWTWQRPSVPDFRPATLLRIGEFGEMPLHVDGADFEQSKPLEEYSWIATESFGDEFALTPMMLVNDDLGAFPQAILDKELAHDQTLNRLCVNILTGDPVMPDGNHLFDDTNHGNDINAAASGGAPSVAELGLIRQRLRKQTGVSAKRKLNLSLFGLLVPEDIETVTEQLLDPARTMVPITDATVNTFRGRVQWWVEPMLADWSTVFYWGFADPRVARSVVHAYQTGYERMVMRNYYDLRKNSRVWQFEGRFAAAANTWRGVVRDAGS